MKKILCYIKPLDIVICALVLLFALVLFLLTAFGDAGAVLFVFANGERTEYALDVDQSLEINADGHTLTVRIEDGAAWVVTSTCHDATCRKKGRISRAGETVLCAPAGVLLRVVARGGGELDASVG
ncbi:MAG: NusG domain II-containing protein [Clostridia bacterium]|nr:NusG domain II-containing protein [Clostridia bacterium]